MTSYDAPLPLGYVRAVERATFLRRKDPVSYSWRTLAEVMETYHGFKRSSRWWQHELLDAGLVKANPERCPQLFRKAA